MANVLKFTKKDAIYACFSNFYECPVEFAGIKYRNSEAAWQSLKTENMEERMKFSTLSGAAAKKSGRKVLLRPDWEEIKYSCMVDICYAKFTQNEKPGEILLSTGEDILVENTTGWHDNLWGNCECPKCIGRPGKNLLGKALMETREKLRKAQSDC